MRAIPKWLQGYAITLLDSLVEVRVCYHAVP